MAIEISGDGFIVPSICHNGKFDHSVKYRWDRLMETYRGRVPLDLIIEVMTERFGGPMMHFIPAAEERVMERVRRISGEGGVYRLRNGIVHQIYLVD
ncbi:MAG: hypothetical protein HYW25_02375 [Candidatus Aenigmarchaeota archaeon]|nr:hypothetical protein [Candidatus Aenigmarchaeota archaeon]